MRKFKVFTHSVLLISTFTSFAYPQSNFPLELFRIQREECKEGTCPYTINNLLSSYDLVMQLLDDIETDEIENKCNEEELDRINHFLALLAKMGLLPGDDEAELDKDIEELLSDDDDFEEDSFSFGRNDGYLFAPANGQYELLLCRSRVSKAWKKTKKKTGRFCKKHKKGLIIGTAVVIGGVGVILAIASCATTGAAAAIGAAGAAASSGSDKKEKDKLATDPKPSSLPIENISPVITTTEEFPILKMAVEEQITSLKETIVDEEFFRSPYNPSNYPELSWEENGRALGSLLAHSGLKNLNKQIPDSSELIKEVQSIVMENPLSLPSDNGSIQFDFGHQVIDSRFSTDYSPLFDPENQDSDFSTLSYQMRGEKALSFGYLKQAINDFDKAIELDPGKSLPYLERGIAHFNLGEYDRSLEDYHRYTSLTQKSNPLSIPEFILGFARGLPEGIYESGEGNLLFLADFITQPIHTAGQMVEALSTLVDLTRNDEWGIIAGSLAPEIHQLITQWDALPSDKRGELAGFALGKLGADIFTPGALVKVAGKSVKSAQKLVSISKNLQIVRETLVLETAAGIGNGAKLAEVIHAGQTTAFLGEELGFTARELGQLKQVGKLETTISNTLGSLSSSSRESFELFARAQEFLKPYKIFMSEAQCRHLIHKTGIQTFPRPLGIPENFRVRISDKGAGLIYVHPAHNHTSM